ncbi:uncharacterized protein [Rhodnius prolixus]|uniref:uncharacterized protein n=1 Tax=Rhodnius prolixus TaxID=13249 RepID=UPI003D18AEDB
MMEMLSLWGAKNNLMVFVFIIIQLVGAFTEKNCPPEVSPYKIVEGSAVGTWFLMFGPRLGDHVLSRRNSCGFFNTIEPCKCIGVNVESEYPPPYVPKYSLRNYGYHDRYEAYATSQLELNLISKTHSIFNVFVPLANLNFTISIIGTDNFENWITITMCDELLDHNGHAGKLTWILSRRYEAEPRTLGAALYSAYVNGYSSEYFVKVNHSACPPVQDKVLY